MSNLRFTMLWLVTASAVIGLPVSIVHIIVNQ
jgi:hypothetical protein